MSFSSSAGGKVGSEMRPADMHMRAALRSGRKMRSLPSKPR